jgi:AraC-like DNA-binding protein
VPQGIPSYVHLLQAKDVMDRRFGESLDVDTLAAVAFASPAHFARSFKRAFGESPHQYLLRRRMERAKELLRHTDRSVTEVCFAVGFSSLGSFSATFRSLVGEPPSAYRDRWREVASDGPPAAIPGCYTMMWTRPVDRAGVRAGLEKRPHPPLVHADLDTHDDGGTR